MAIANGDGSPKTLDLHGSFTIYFNDIKYSVQEKGPDKSAKRKYILKGISGACVPGRLQAIMGSSGAGKTTVCGCHGDIAISINHNIIQW